MYQRSPQVRVPEALRIEFALSDRESVIHRGAFLVTEAPGHSVFGVSEAMTLTDVPPLGAQLFAGVIVEHEIGVRAARRYIHFYDVNEDLRQQVLLGEMALEVGFETAEEWQSVPLEGHFAFSFKLTPLLGLSGA